MERHPARVCENQTDGCSPGYHGAAKNPQTHRRRKGMGAPAPDPASPLFEMPAGNNEEAQNSVIDSVPPSYVSIYNPVPITQCAYGDAYAKDGKYDKALILDMLTDNRMSTCLHTICCVMM